MSSLRNTKVQNSVKDICGIKFTSREIEIISCIVNNKKNKQTASLLLISHRTVETYVRNIIQKLGCVSREDIAKFIQKSGKFELINAYYYNLLSQNVFEKQLQKIRKLNKEKLICILGTHYTTEEHKVLLLRMQNDLQSVGIILSNQENPTQCIDHIRTICIFSENIIANPKANNVIYLILDKNIDPISLDNNEYIDFRKEENYHLSALKLIKKILDNIQLDKIIEEFNNECLSLGNAAFEDANTNLNSTVMPQLTKGNKGEVVKVSIVILTSSCLLASIFFDINTYLPKIFDLGNIHYSNNRTDDVIDRYNNLIEKFTEAFAADNINKEQIQKNHNLVKQFEELLIQYNQEKIQIYFNKKDVSSDKLAHYLYNLHALANYYTYNNHDGEKALQILTHAKSLLQNYVSHRSNVSFDFDKLTPEELCTELSIAKDFPEIYTRIIYSLGRSYMYLYNKELAERYFVLSKHLGDKLSLFEGYLSFRSGLGIIERERADLYIEDHDYKKAQEKLCKLIELYKKLKYDDSKYRVNYKPDQSAQIVIPKDDIYNSVECAEQIVMCYNKLIHITDEPEKKIFYAQDALEQFIGNTKFQGMLAQIKGLSDRKKASVYNTLGALLMQLYNQSIKAKDLNNKILKELSLSVEDDLEIIEYIFNLAISHSRNTDFTKADGYRGLIEVYQKRIDTGSISDEQKALLSQKIFELKTKRDYINKTLNRNPS